MVLLIFPLTPVSLLSPVGRAVDESPRGEAYAYLIKGPFQPGTNRSNFDWLPACLLPLVLAFYVIVLAIHPAVRFAALALLHFPAVLWRNQLSRYDKSAAEALPNNPVPFDGGERAADQHAGISPSQACKIAYWHFRLEFHYALRSRYRLSRRELTEKRFPPTDNFLSTAVYSVIHVIRISHCASFFPCKPFAMG
jgi:hypothetical protein